LVIIIGQLIYLNFEDNQLHHGLLGRLLPVTAEEPVELAAAAATLLAIVLALLPPRIPATRAAAGALKPAVAPATLAYEPGVKVVVAISIMAELIKGLEDMVAN
jgi:hypothetical protein